MAIATGATVFGDEAMDVKLEQLQMHDFGEVGEVVVTKDDTLMLNGRGSLADVDARVVQIDDAIENSNSEYEKEKLAERKARLSGGVAVVRVGGSSEVEVGEKEDRVDDALCATRAAVEEGIVPGGGVALLRCVPKLLNVDCANKDEQIGVDIVSRAIRVPCETISNNAGVEGRAVVEKILAGAPGYNAHAGEYVDMIQAGIIDPTKVIKQALTDASGVASLLTTAECVITEIKEDAPAVPMG